MAAPAELDDILSLETIELDIFRGRSPAGSGARIFGGQVVAQALAAAYRTVDARICHSLHAYFIHPGDPSIPILFQVERARDGRSFTTRRVRAIQHGRQIFNLAASFQVAEPGFEHQSPMPDVPLPADPPAIAGPDPQRGALPDEPLFWPIELRPLESAPTQGDGVEQNFSFWFRARAPLGDDLAINQCALAYASDLSLLHAALRVHDISWKTEGVQAASLDHALWFHRPFQFNDWHLYVQDSPSASSGRGFSRGEIYGRDGRLVASAAQEGLIRLRPPPA